MKIDFQFKSLPQYSFQYCRNSYFSSDYLSIDGKILDKLKNTYCFVSEDGQTIEIFAKPQPFDSIPKFVIDAEEISIAPPLKWYQQILMFLPFVLIVQGGAIGGAFGGLGFVTNTRVFRSDLSPLFQYIVSIIVTIASAILYLITSALFVYFIDSNT